jgi:hypothetical protein
MQATQSRWQAEKFEPASRRHAHYDRKFFDTDNAHIFFWHPHIDSRQAGWLELMLIQFAYSIGIGVNDNRDSPNNMATLPGRSCSWASPGCV